MKVKYSTFLQIGIGLLLLLNSYVLKAYGIETPFYVETTILLPICLAVICFISYKIREKIRPFCKYVNKFVIAWFLFFAIQISYTLSLYEGHIELSKIVNSYSGIWNILLVYPIIYILIVAKEKILGTILVITMWDNAQRMLTSLLHSFFGVSLFPGMVEKLGEVRYFMERFTATKFHIFSYGVLLGKTFDETQKKKNFLYILVAFSLFYQLAIDQSRTSLLCFGVVLFLWIYYTIIERAKNKEKTQMFLKTAIIVAIIVFLIAGGITYVMESFSTTGIHSGSTLNRIYSLKHYWEQMQGKQLLGMGLIYDDYVYGSSYLYELLRNPDTQMGYMTFFEDFGLLGQYFNYGLVGLALFCVHFIREFLIVKKCRAEGRRKTYQFGALLFVHVLASSILPISIFKNDMLIVVPFYIAIFEYMNLEDIM